MIYVLPSGSSLAKNFFNPYIGTPYKCHERVKNVLVTIPVTSKAAKGSIFERMLAKSDSMAGLKSHASVPDLCTKKERKTKSSGYGKSFEVKMFQPMINSRYANYQQCYALQTI